MVYFPALSEGTRIKTPHIMLIDHGDVSYLEVLVLAPSHCKLEGYGGTHGGYQPKTAT